MKLEPTTNVGGGFGWNIEAPLPPAGQYVAVCLDIRDELGVERPTFENPQIREKRDITRFLFGMLHPQTKQPYLVQTFEFNISGGANSNLVKFLKAWTNRDPYGSDYLGLKGQGALLTVGHKQSAKNNIVYAIMSGVSPVYPTLQAEIPNPAMFDALIAKANQPRQQAAPAASPIPAGTSGPLPLGMKKFWTQGPSGIVLATDEQIIAKGEPQRLIMAENQQGGWVAANTVMQFPVALPPLLGPVAPPAPPAAMSPWGAPPPPSSLPTAQDDEIPF